MMLVQAHVNLSRRAKPDIPSSCQCSRYMHTQHPLASKHILTSLHTCTWSASNASSQREAWSSHEFLLDHSVQFLLFIWSASTAEADYPACPDGTIRRCTQQNRLHLVSQQSGELDKELMHVTIVMKHGYSGI